MTSGNPEHGSITGLVESLERGDQPLSKWAATSLREIYLQNEFSFGRLRGPRDIDIKRAPQAIRIIALLDDSFKGLSIVYSNSSDEETRSLGMKLRNEVARLPDVGSDIMSSNQLITQVLLEQRRQTVAALEISTAQDNSEIVQVLYPKLLRPPVRNMFSSIGIVPSELFEREAAMAIAIGYLRAILFTSAEPRILTPENIE